MKKVLFIDRDGTLVIEPPLDYQLDSLEKLEFYPGVFYNMRRIAKELDYELVMVTNQDGLGTSSFPSETFWPPQEKMIKAFENEGVLFSAIHIDPSLPAENSPNRKPKTGMLQAYYSSDYDLENSFVIGDRLSDMQLAENLGCKGILIGKDSKPSLKCVALETLDWSAIYTFLVKGERIAEIQRKTNETDISIQLNLNGTGISQIDTGIAFFDHMLCQIAKHGLVDLSIKVIGDLEVDEHHTIEDTAIALGEVFRKALGSKIGIERYGYLLPMDDCLTQVAIDFGGRNWLVWEAMFEREMIGKMPTEMFFHFFKSFTDGALCNLNIKAEGTNEHHKIESIFKSFAKAIKMAIQQDPERMILPTTKGLL
ncbi:MAG: imidazoleglycerol-phosphate dehydratase/histidinol-phosphatase [Crocinitomix sp.]|jgi:imidazoleglycerol-phosphate dehydratase/histidinol-phosphatase